MKCLNNEALNNKVMNGFLISFNGCTSEWISSFETVESFMELLENKGIVSNVNVMQFVGGLMKKSIVYNYNGESWEK